MKTKSKRQISSDKAKMRAERLERAKHAQEIAEAQTREVDMAIAGEAADLIVGHLLQTVLAQEKETADRKAMWKEMVTPTTFEKAEPTVVINEPAKEGELFGQEVEKAANISPKWKGWKLLGSDCNLPYYKDFGYFEFIIRTDAFETMEDLETHAKSIVDSASEIRYAAEGGSSLNTCLELRFGVGEEEFAAEYCQELYLYMARMHKVGTARYKQEISKALKTKAIAGKGDLDAQKTILRQQGELAAEAKVGAGSGSLTIVMDNDDVNL